MAVIPFYGTDHPELFAIERAAMDCPGLVIERLNDVTALGNVLDIGAGAGSTAEHLARPDRTVYRGESGPELSQPTRLHTQLKGVPADAIRLVGEGRSAGTHTRGLDHPHERDHEAHVA